METSFIAQNFVPLMFAALFVFLLSGIPVAFGLAATGLFMGFIGMEAGLFGGNLFQALPLRVFGIMQNDTLLAIPFFTLMGIILERSGMAEDLLETVGQVFGPVRGGLAIAVILVGALLAATTGVVAAAVISMGLISLPIMLRYGYNRTIATGTITASGTLAQAIPPSLVLIVLADQLGRSVGDMYAGALIPGLILVGLYLGFVALVAIFKPKWVPALPAEARIYREPDGASGHRSLLILFAVCAVAGVAWSKVHQSVINPLIDRQLPAPGDEIFILSMTVASVLALALALVNKFFKIGLLSRLTEQVTFVLIPPLVLIFLVLGTIFLGIATPTEGGAMGAMGALIMAAGPRQAEPVAAHPGAGQHRQAVVLRALHPGRLHRLQLHLQCRRRAHLGRAPVRQHARRRDGLPDRGEHPGVHPRHVHRLLRDRLHRHPDPGAGGREDPARAAARGHAAGDGADLVRRDHRDEPADLVPHAALRLCAVLPAQRGREEGLQGPHHRRDDPGGGDDQIYKGSIAFICVQLVMVAALIIFPTLVTGGIEQAVQIDADKALESMQESSKAGRDSSGAASAVPAMPGAPAASGAEGGSEKEDPMKGLLDSMKADEGKKP